MTEKPLIVRTALARDWPEAFRTVRIETLKIAAPEMGIPLDKGLVEARGASTDWNERRVECHHLMDRFLDAGNPTITAAWAMLAADPSALSPARTSSDHRDYRVALAGLADAVVRRPDLLDDEAFAKAVFGWRFSAALGRLAQQKDWPDQIAAARVIGEPITIDRDEMLTWAAATIAEAGKRS